MKSIMTVSVSLSGIFIIHLLCPSFLCQGIMQFVRMVPAVVFDLAGFFMGLAVGKPRGHAVALVEFMQQDISALRFFYGVHRSSLSF